MPGLQFLKGGQEDLVRRGDPVPLDFQSLQQPEQSPSILSHLKTEILEGEGKGESPPWGPVVLSEVLAPFSLSPPSAKGSRMPWRACVLWLCIVWVTLCPELPGLHPRPSQCSSGSQVCPLLEGLLGTRGGQKPPPSRHTHSDAGSCQHL